MPIYEYLCNSCGAEKEHLQKISDAPIAVCPVCGSSNYIKRIS
ncbi:MAG: zinc ribbon domain-containing protein, partial [Nitrosomonas sp.]|nr:zinc ribbon domain-containing protein [Nitrosomonas sp.]MCC8996127.1 zinc ribbon domain-containing protein [Nitrosomonas sp.]